MTVQPEADREFLRSIQYRDENHLPMVTNRDYLDIVWNDYLDFIRDANLDEILSGYVNVLWGANLAGIWMPV